MKTAVPCCANRSPRTLCENMEVVLKADFPGSARRPYNHYKPTLTDWYFVPSAELPFYRFGKLVFSWDEEKRDSIFCGLSVIKGLSPALKALYPSKKGHRFLMGDNWVWPDLYRSIVSGQLSEILALAMRETGVPVEWRLTAGYVDDPSQFDPYVDNQYPRDRYVLCPGPAEGTWRVLTARRDAMTLKCLNLVRTSRELAAAVEKLSREDFLFLTLEVGFRFPIAAEESAPGALTAPDVYRQYLSRFAPWIR